MALKVIVIIAMILVFMVAAYLYADGIGQFIYNIILYLKGEDKNE